MSEILPYVLEVGAESVMLTPDAEHEFTAGTIEVAIGYGVTPDAIRMQKHRHADELIEGKHWVVTDRYAAGGTQQVTLWTKRGIVRLGFFIRSERARLFRDMAEDLVIKAIYEETVPKYGQSEEMISARGVGATMKCTPKAASNRLRRANILPAAHYLDGLCRAPGYLYPLAEVRAAWPERRFNAFQGQILPGTQAVQHIVRKQKEGVIAKEHRPRLIPTDTPTEQLARRLLSLEAQKRAVLRELAVL